MASSEEKAFWVPDEDTPSCQLCEVPFTLTRRRHHCRKCGSCVCGPCSRRKGGDGTRLCDECWSAGVESAHEQSAQAAWRESSEALRYRLRWTGSTVEATGAALLARVYALDGSSTTQAYDESTTARELARAAAAAFVGDDRSGAYGSLWTARRGDSLDALDFVDDDERVGDVLARFRVLGRARFAKLVVPVRPRHAALSVARPKRRDREKAADRHPALLKADAATRFAGRLAVERGGELDSGSPASRVRAPFRDDGEIL